MPVLINREGGAAKAAGDRLEAQVEAAFDAAGAQADVQMLPADGLADAIERAATEYPRIVIAGGDGTVASAAQLLTGKDVELAILPLGTLNHFARDLEIPTDLAKAAQLAAKGMAKPVDVAEVNGRRFVNNASVGLYPFMVRDREAIQDRKGWPKWLAMVPASWDAVSRLHHHRLRIDMGAGAAPIVTPLLFVGNNRYSLDAGSVGSRETVNDGKLSVYAVSHASRPALLWFGLRAALGLADRGKDFAALGDTEALTVRGHAATIEIALDGEVKQLDLPLKFKIRAGGLRVVQP
ncbi:NAD(+)/NADH kinase [Sphingomonas sp. R-74633]|nr:NAD(+)/NADH kinase [Sphingomonas sp. R-74633]